MRWGSRGRNECREVGAEVGTAMRDPMESIILVKVALEEVKKGPSDVKIVGVSVDFKGMIVQKSVQSCNEICGR